MGKRIWIDDMRQAPDGYIWCKSVRDAKETIFTCVAAYNSGNNDFAIDLIDLDHDAGDFACDGGDYIAVLDFLTRYRDEMRIKDMETVFRIHSMNVVGRQNMIRIIERNGWRLIN